MNGCILSNSLILFPRSWAKSGDGNGIILSFTMTNTWTDDLDIGGLGFPMPQAGMQNGIEESVWLDPHVGGDHGFVESVRVVVDEQTLLATAEGAGTPLEAWRPLLEGCTSDDWEWTVHSKAWADEWAENKQFPFLKMDERLANAVSKMDNKTVLWPKPHHSPWLVLLIPFYRRSWCSSCSYYYIFSKGFYCPSSADVRSSKHT